MDEKFRDRLISSSSGEEVLEIINQKEMEADEEEKKSSNQVMLPAVTTKGKSLPLQLVQQALPIPIWLLMH